MRSLKCSLALLPAPEQNLSWSADLTVPPLPEDTSGYSPNAFVHGYDDLSSPDPALYTEGGYPDVRGIFMARGPAFR